jgi:hypothetical protein
MQAYLINFYRQLRSGVHIDMPMPNLEQEFCAAQEGSNELLGCWAVEVVPRSRATFYGHLLPIPFLGRRHSRHTPQAGYHSRTSGNGG